MISLKVGKDIFDYINNVRNAAIKRAMKKRIQEYAPKPDIVEKFERVQDKRFIVVFSTEWSSDCQAQIPFLAKLLLAANNDNLTVRVVDYDENRDIAEELGVLNIPVFIIYDRNWRELGRVVRGPQRYATLEEELWAIMEGALNSGY
jgi:thiol-disulfide isomerase/thioredoxin